MAGQSGIRFRPEIVMSANSHTANAAQRPSGKFGLSSAVLTKDKERGVRFALGIHAGMTHVNYHNVDDAPTGPFGGEKNSGVGRFGGNWIIDEFTRAHWITVRHEKDGYPI
jgi:aldehyde dehydrogenase (NAD+)